jgi:exosortase/archaeosortase family protein
VARLRAWSTYPAFRAVLVLVAVAIAYRYSLRTLLGTVGTDTPLAYLGLAPLIAFGVALLLGRPGLPSADIHDRHLDYLIGVPLLATSILMTVVLPARMSLLFWYYRVDLLSLPLFVAGVVALLFGGATLWRVRYAVGFLLLAWPAPYNWALAHGMGSFSNFTLGSLRVLTHLIPIAHQQTGGDGSIFILHHGTTFFTLSVASACTGVDSFVGFLLVGLAVTTVVDGPKAGRVLWIATGMALSFVLNLLRLMLIFWVGGQYGEKVALDGLHPVLGLILFCGGVAAMVTGLRIFRLEVKAGPPKPAADAPARPQWRLSNNLRLAATAVVIVTAIVAVADGGFGRYGPVASDLGSPRLVSFTEQPIVPPGWSVSPIDHYPWASQYFGSGALWSRYQFAPTTATAGTTVLADVVNTSDLQSFSTYDVISCYDYHGYGLSGEKRVALGDGVEATELTFNVPTLTGQWNALYWVWPVKSGSGVRYERIVLLDPVQIGYTTVGTVTGADASTRTIGPAARQESRAFLQQFGRQLVTQRAATPGGGAA